MCDGQYPSYHCSSISHEREVLAYPTTIGSIMCNPPKTSAQKDRAAACTDKVIVTRVFTLVCCDDVDSGDVMVASICNYAYWGNHSDSGDYSMY